MDDLISRQAAIDALNGIINRFEQILRDIRESKVDDSVCGMCEYDGAFVGQSGDWCNECPGFDKADCFKLSDERRKKWLKELDLPSAQPDVPDTNVGDLISRQAAIAALVGITIFKTKHELMQRVNASVQDEQGWLGAVAECLDEIEDLPSAQPEQRWIPCSERLPEGITQVIIQTNGEAIHEAIYMGKDDYGHYVWKRPDNEIYWDEEVVAWMPLPEPYKTESEDKE